MNNSDFPEMVEGLAHFPNGEVKLIGKVPMSAGMKINDIARSYFGWDYDEDSNTAMAIQAMKEFHEWFLRQQAAVDKMENNHE